MAARAELALKSVFFLSQCDLVYVSTSLSYAVF